MFVRVSRSRSGRLHTGRLGASRLRLALLVIGLGGVGCGTVCDDASTICGFETTSSAADCVDANECASLCIVDWDSCDVNNADAPESKCIAACLTQAEDT